MDRWDAESRTHGEIAGWIVNEHGVDNSSRRRPEGLTSAMVADEMRVYSRERLSALETLLER